MTKINYKYNEPLSAHTSFRLGGYADIYAEVFDIGSLREVLKFAKKNKLPIYIIGGGTNLLVRDNGIRGITLSLKGGFSKISRKKNVLVCGAGAPLALAVKKSADLGLAGMEFLTGIPGSVGGAIAVNAGTKERWINHVAKSVTVMDLKGKTRKLAANKIKAGYRTSSLKEKSGLIIISVEIVLKKGDKAAVKKEVLRILKIKKAGQPAGKGNAGCVFRNPAKDYAGRLIDKAGLKGKKVGKAAVSMKHANFIVNSGSSSEDVLALIELIKKEVKAKFKVGLKEEIIITGEK